VPRAYRLEPIDSGTIQFDGRPLPVEGRALARLRSEVGMVFRSFNLFAHKTVLDNVNAGADQGAPGAAGGGPAARDGTAACLRTMSETGSALLDGGRLRRGDEG
jgi:ABC-type proline/glycine betaine transport system ATPase subunit